MSEEFGANYLTVTDDEGNEFELEIIDEIEFEGDTYTVFLPADIDEMDTDDPDYGFVILQNIEENGEEVFASVDDDAKLDRIFEYYMELVEAEEAEDPGK